MRILGIDPGYAIVGFGIIDTDRNNAVVDYGVIETPKEDPLPVRLQAIDESLRVIFENYKPDQVAIEELFYFRNQTTVIPVAQARGVIVLVRQKYCGSGRIFEYTPMQIKQALTGSGRADKKQMQYMVKNVLGLAQIPKPDDAADALAVALCHSQINPRLNFNQV